MARLRIDTSIDESGFSSGLANMSKQVDQFVSSVTGGFGKADKAWGARQNKKIASMSGRFDKQNASIQRQEVAVNALLEKLRALSNVDTAPRSLTTMQSAVEKTEARLAKLIEQFEQLSFLQGVNVANNIGPGDARFDTTDAELEKLGERIRTAEANLDRLKTKLATVKMNPQASDEGVKLAERIALAQQRLDDMRVTANETQQALKALQHEKPPASGPWQKFKAAIAGIGKESHKSGRRMGFMERQTSYLARTLRNTVFQGLMFYHLRRALIKLSKTMVGVLKQNAEFSASLGAIKGNFLAAFSPIYSAILPALNALMSALARAAAMVRAFVALLFGSTVASANAGAKALDGLASSAGGAGGAAKEAKGELASFDKIEVLNEKDDSGGGGGGGGGIVPTPTPEDEATTGFVVELVEWLKKLWDVAEPTRAALGRLWDELKRLAGFAWQGLKDFYTEFLVPVGTWALGEGIPRLVDGLVNMSKSIDWDLILQKFRELWAVLAPFTIHVGEGLLWFYEKVLLPVAGWAVGNLFPAVLSLITALISSLDKVVQSFKPEFEKFYNDVLVPIGNWTGQALIDALGWISGALTDIGDWIAANPEFADFFIKLATVLGTLTVAVWAYNAAQAIMNAIMAANPVGLVIIGIALLVAAIWWLIDNWELVKTTAIGVWNSIVDAWNASLFKTEILDPLVAWFSQAWKDITAWVTKAWTDVSTLWGKANDWYVQNVINPIAGAFEVAWAAIKGFINDPLGTIYGLWMQFEAWFKKWVIDPVSKAFEDAWASITGWVTGAWESIKTIWTDAATWFETNVTGPIKKLFEDIVSAITGWWNGLMELLGQKQTVTIETRYTSSDGIEYGGRGGTLPGADKVPGLATGAVIPPNSKFAAILGDQKSGNNIEAPESLIRKIVREEAGRNRAQIPVIQFTGDLAGLARILKPIVKMEDDRMGMPLTVGGDF